MFNLILLPLQPPNNIRLTYFNCSKSTEPYYIENKS
jgi:hypothetical protein